MLCSGAPCTNTVRYTAMSPEPFKDIWRSFQGRQEAARTAVRAGLALDPTFTIRRARLFLTSVSESQTERIFDGMHKVGVPEG
jgi:hypothetical protein